MKLTQSELAKKLGLSMSYVHQLENNKRTPSDAVETLVGMLETQFESGLIRPEKEDSILALHQEIYKPIQKPKLRPIPVIGMAHAGEITNYEEIPPDWQDVVYAECHDPKAFGVRLEGDSMARDYLPKDILVLMPSEEIYNGGLAVVKLKNDGYVFRQVERRATFLRTIPINTQYPTEQIPLEEVEWAYPLHTMVRLVWDR